MMAGIKYHLHNSRRIPAWKNDKWKLSNPPNLSITFYIIW